MMDVLPRVTVSPSRIRPITIKILWALKLTSITFYSIACFSLALNTWRFWLLVLLDLSGGCLIIGSHRVWSAWWASFQRCLLSHHSLLWSRYCKFTILFDWLNGEGRWLWTLDLSSVYLECHRILHIVIVWLGQVTEPSIISRSLGLLLNLDMVSLLEGYT